MGAWSKVMGFFGFGTEPEPVKAEPVKSKGAPRTRRSGDMLELETLQPKSYADAPEIAENLRQGLPVVVYIGAMSEAEARRILDFMVGLKFALEGHFSRMTQKVYIISPTHIPIANAEVVDEAEFALAES